MTGEASSLVEDYLARLRHELELADADDVDDVVAEVRSLLTDAGGGEAASVAAQIERLGDPEELVGGILMERGHDASAGIPSRVWWRLGIAAPIDIAIGLSVPLAAAGPLAGFARAGQPRAAAVLLAVALGLASLAWPFFVWRPWRRGGRALSPGMTIVGMAVVRTPGMWRPVALEDLPGPRRPRRALVPAILIALVSATLLAVTAALAFGAVTP